MSNVSSVYVGVRRAHRGALITISIIGLVLGAIGLVWPQATLFTVAIIFGIYLIASGIFRIAAAFMQDEVTAGMRWLSGILGAFVVAAGIFCIADPVASLTVLAFVIGIGWIAEGVIDIVGGVRSVVKPRWFAFVSGTLSIVAGFVMFVLPTLALAAFVIVASILLIVVSVSTLLTLPPKRAFADTYLL
ncbi:hypothetical protein GY21_20475 [Cryobacterium roopkundense]|uniref:Uncharacterized membrane protein HdeD (DUF308 family) n=1 Tax=Cryobacterium roopkundense TaxID=1001240 RepID=A0A099J0C1_9MICO|nr:DUF308 domain-containing protein [Cryobacterium roopkundense]KGJ71686.1 hypothetical protein GY21_20475 [Cryobacterium roopkundense]MBB5640679.1 uncharacterized membrane protein HdeD (DUF308 family) [Cryobacterium roopkundense]